MNNIGRITRRMLLMMFTGLICQYMFSQQVDIISATRQGWAGGVCCVHGVNYEVNVKVILNKHPITFDTLWTEGYCHSLAQYNSKTFKPKDTLNLQFYGGITHDDRTLYSIDKQPEVLKPCYNANKKGVILQYRVNDKIYSLDITPYIKELVFLAYP